MHLEDYFDFQRPDDIRIRGTRIGIEIILYEYIHRSQSPEDIAVTYRTLTLEQVYATILYYLRNRESVDGYLSKWMEYGLSAERAFDQNPPLVAVKVREARVARDAGMDANAGPLSAR